MRSSKQISMAAIMWLAVAAALELALFEEFRFVRFMLLILPIMMTVLSLNLGILFILIRPRLFESRIAGMLLGGPCRPFCPLTSVPQLRCNHQLDC
jgi:hypothetical protein